MSFNTSCLPCLAAYDSTLKKTRAIMSVENLPLNATLLPLCVAPFLPESHYPYRGGSAAGRYCASLALTGGESCCLPCPQTDWVYGDDYRYSSLGADWVAVLGASCCLLMIISYAVLPVEKTRLNLLTTFVMVSVTAYSLAFIIPLGAKPEMCFDAITPNDMHTSPACALSGASLMVGGFCTITWILVHALKLHLHICWNIIPNRKFEIASQVAGWSVPIILATTYLSLGGVSYRLSSTCFPNHKDSLYGVWVPILILTAIASVCHTTTIAYCTKIYFECHMKRFSVGVKMLSFSPGTNASKSVSLSSRQAYNHMVSLVKLNWRTFIMVAIIVTDVIFYCINFLIFDGKASYVAKEVKSAEPWLICLAISNGDKDSCLHLTGPLVLDQRTVSALLVLASTHGLWAFMLHIRWSVFTGWAEFFRTHVLSHRLFPIEKRPAKDTVERQTIDVEKNMRGSFCSPVGTFHSFGASIVAVPGKCNPLLPHVGPPETSDVWSFSSESQIGEEVQPLSPLTYVPPVRPLRFDKPLPRVPSEVARSASWRYYP